jgi:hypothetical protein
LAGKIIRLPIRKDCCYTKDVVWLVTYPNLA